MSSNLTVARTLLAVAGALVGLYGAVRLIGLGWGNLVATLPWLAGVVVAHDALLAPLVALIGAAAAGRLPRWSRRAAVVVLVVLGPVTLLAVPTLGKFGAKADNPTLLDRQYVAGWVAVTGLVLVAAALLAVHDRGKGAPRG